MPAVGTLLCRWNLVISNNTRTWRPNEKLIPAGLIWGNTVSKFKGGQVLTDFKQDVHSMRRSEVVWASSADFCHAEHRWSMILSLERHKKVAQAALHHNHRCYDGLACLKFLVAALKLGRQCQLVIAIQPVHFTYIKRF